MEMLVASVVFGVSAMFGFGGSHCESEEQWHDQTKEEKARPTSHVASLDTATNKYYFSSLVERLELALIEDFCLKKNSF